MQNNMQNNSGQCIFCIFCILQYAKYARYVKLYAQICKTICIICKIICKIIVDSVYSAYYAYSHMQNMQNMHIDSSAYYAYCGHFSFHILHIVLHILHILLYILAYPAYSAYFVAYSAYSISYSAYWCILFWAGCCSAAPEAFAWFVVWVEALMCSRNTQEAGRGRVRAAAAQSRIIDMNPAAAPPEQFLPDLLLSWSQVFCQSLMS